MKKADHDAASDRGTVPGAVLPAFVAKPHSEGLELPGKPVKFTSRLWRCLVHLEIPPDAEARLIAAD